MLLVYMPKKFLLRRAPQGFFQPRLELLAALGHRPNLHLQAVHTPRSKHGALAQALEAGDTQ